MISVRLNKFFGRIVLAGASLWLAVATGDAHEPAPPKTQSSTALLNVKAPDFVLTDQDGKRFDSAALRGKVVAIDFIYTTCTDVCPLFTANFAQMQRVINKEHPGSVFFLSITTDPEIDSPQVLKSYAQRYGVDFRNWAFLTGTPSQLKPVWNGLGIRVINKGRGIVQHTSLTTLLDRRGIRRFNHFGEKWQTKEVLNDLSSLINEKPAPH
ncbi:MAG TPA: SCO family protein [Candidatus Binatia bacterium]|jgi:protein SCO1/2